MSFHETFTIPSKYAVNYHEFQTVITIYADTECRGVAPAVTTTPKVPREIIEQLLTITDQELCENMNTTNTDLLTWLRYKATTLRKVLSSPGNFTFLKYGQSTGPPYWLLNVMYAAVNTLDAWVYLRTQVGNLEPGILISQTPILEQLGKLVSGTGVFYTQAEYKAAMKTLVYIAKNGWSRYVWS
jgi:hypothetical protein